MLIICSLGIMTTFASPPAQAGKHFDKTDVSFVSPAVDVATPFVIAMHYDLASLQITETVNNSTAPVLLSNVPNDIFYQVRISPANWRMCTNITTERQINFAILQAEPKGNDSFTNPDEPLPNDIVCNQNRLPQKS